MSGRLLSLQLSSEHFRVICFSLNSVSSRESGSFNLKILGTFISIVIDFQLNTILIGTYTGEHARQDSEAFLK